MTERGDMASRQKYMDSCVVGRGNKWRYVDGSWPKSRQSWSCVCLLYCPFNATNSLWLKHDKSEEVFEFSIGLYCLERYKFIMNSTLRIRKSTCLFYCHSNVANLIRLKHELMKSHSYKLYNVYMNIIYAHKH